MTTVNNADTGEHNQSARPRTEHGGLDAAREHRDDLETLAETDLPAAAWAQAILDLLDAEDANGGGPA
jgi:hypothetical protein